MPTSSVWADTITRSRTRPELPIGAIRQPRQQPAMIDVGVGQQYEIERGRIESETRAVLAVGLAPALEHAAVDQETQAVGFDQETGSGDFARGAEERQFHNVASRASCVRAASSAISASLITYGGMK